MAKYRVLRLIEHSKRLYLPKREKLPADWPEPAEGADRSGFIELTDLEAAAMKTGQIEAVKAKKAE